MVILSIFILAIRRLWATRWLILATLVGQVVVVSLALSVPMYSDAVYHRILHKEVSSWGEHRRPPFSFMYRYVGSSSSVADWQTVSTIDQLMVNQMPDMLGLKRDLLIRYFASDSFPAYKVDDSSRSKPVLWGSMGFASDLAEHINLVEGQFPADMQGNTLDEEMPVLLSKLQADKLGLQVGEQFIAIDRGNAARVGNEEISRIPIVIAGVWTPKDESDLYWYSDPAVWKDVLFTSEANFARRIAPQLKEQKYLAVWYMLMNGDPVRASGVGVLLERMNTTMTRLTSILPGMRLDQSPTEALKKYERTANLLMVQLFAFSIPILALAFVFIALVAGLITNNQRGEIAVMRSRGASILQIMGITLAEAVVVGVVALLASAPAGEWIARLVGQTRSFLDFSGLAGVGLLSTAVTLDSMRIGVATVLVAIMVTVLPTLGAAGYTVVTYRQERARSLRPPWWQRMWLDVLIFIPAAYGTYLLDKQGAIAVRQVISPGAASTDPFSNPLLFLVPMLAMVALALFVIRLLPLVLRLLTWLFGLLPGTSLLLAMRQLARSPGFYSAPILLLTLTLALATFTASLAATLDQSMYDQARYRVGGDMALTELMDEFSGTGAAAIAQDASLTDEERIAIQAARARSQLVQSMPPVSDHQQVDGVHAAARVGRYPAAGRVGGSNQRAEFIGIDRLDFAQVSYWRKDFAQAPLGTLMNALAASSDSVLVPQSVLDQYGLRVGDTIIVRVSLKEGSAELKLRVAGSFHLWPGWYPAPNGSTLFVGNLEYLAEIAGYQTPYRVWLKLDEAASVKNVALGVLDKGFNLVAYESTNARITSEQARPERQGLFGLLSMGFASSALLTVLGFFLYSVFSFRRRLIELGVLRAIGFSALQMAAFLGWELVLLLGIGIGAGTGLGVLASQVYIPYMQVGTTVEATTVPYQIIIAWENVRLVYTLFGALFVVAFGALFVLLLRMKVFQAVKMGESL